jgi:lipoate-protein ligase A
VVRIYRWRRPTWSLGVHQKLSDAPRLKKISPEPDAVRFVRRPTGGRAILHGEDTSFSFITNDPAICRATLCDSYRLFMGWVRDALEEVGIATQSSCETDHRAYSRSSLCFETSTPFDLRDESGRKFVGSAQVRRAGAILQHGAIFFPPGTTAETRDAFDAALFNRVANALALKPEVPPEPDEGLKALLRAYGREAAGILASASTTSGSHLTPASR